MTRWAAFAGLTGVVLFLLLVLSVLTQRAFEKPQRSPDADDGSELEPSPPEPEAPPPSELEASSPDPRVDGRIADSPDEQPRDGAPIDDGVTDPNGGSDASEQPKVDPQELSTGALLANVAFSQGLFAVVLLGGAIYAAVPPEALGVAFDREYLRTGLVVGAVLGVALYVANELGAATAKRFGLDHDEELRELLAPETPKGWLVLLVVVLPIVAFFEELLFRAALIGALSAGFGVSEWLLAVLSSAAFALGHGMQGTTGIVVTGLLGFALAAAFVLTESLLVVVVAHYLINALEFVVHEGVGYDWAETTGS